MKRLTLLLSILMFSMTLFATENQFKDINKDMRIMTRIIETSLSESQSNRFGARVESRYLAKQGMLFTIHGANTFHVLGMNSGNPWEKNIEEGALSLVQSIMPALAPIAPEAAIAVEQELAEEFENIEAERIYSEEIRDQLEDLRNEIRDRKEDYRDNLRELRQIERERYRAEKDRLKDLDKRKAELNHRISENKEVMEQYQKKMEEYREQTSKKYNDKKQKVINNVIGTLCDYSASLRSLSNNEHVTLIFDNYGAGRSSNHRDLIYVFKKNLLTSCDSDESGIKKLKERAISYQQ